MSVQAMKMRDVLRRGQGESLGFMLAWLMAGSRIDVCPVNVTRGIGRDTSVKQRRNFNASIPIDGSRRHFQPWRNATNYQYGNDMPPNYGVPIIYVPRG